MAVFLQDMGRRCQVEKNRLFSSVLSALSGINWKPGRQSLKLKTALPLISAIQTSKEKEYEMFGKIVKIIAGMFLVLLLSACSGSENIIGRWELEFGSSGSAYEFYEDGTGAFFGSVDPFYMNVQLFTYTYDSKSGALQIFPVEGPAGRTIEYQVSFESKNMISIEERSMVMPGFVRKPLPKLPPGARARIGGLMLGRNFTFIEADQLKSGWETDYLAIGRKISLSSGNAAIWLVTLQIDGNAKLYVLREADGQPFGWEAISVIAAPENVPADVKEAVEYQSPGAVILSAHRSAKTIDGVVPWCVVYQPQAGALTRMVLAETWLIENVSEAGFTELGCTNP